MTTEAPYVQIHDRALLSLFRDVPIPSILPRNPREGGIFSGYRSNFLLGRLFQPALDDVQALPPAQLPLRGLAAGDEDLPAGDAL